MFYTTERYSLVISVNFTTDSESDLFIINFKHNFSESVLLFCLNTFKMRIKSLIGLFFKLK